MVVDYSVIFPLELADLRAREDKGLTWLLGGWVLSYFSWSY